MCVCGVGGRGGNGCYLLQLIAVQRQRLVNTLGIKNSNETAANQRGPHNETLHASSIKELDGSTAAEALMVIERGFLRGCQLARQDSERHPGPLVSSGGWFGSWGGGWRKWGLGEAQLQSA